MASTRNDPEADLQGTFPGSVEAPRSRVKRPLTGRFALRAAAARELEERTTSDLGRGRDLAGLSEDIRLEAAANFRAIREQTFGAKTGQAAVSAQVEVVKLSEPTPVVSEQQLLSFE